jgi:hypothetical protein
MMAEEQIIDALDEAQEIIPFTYSITLLSGPIYRKLNDNWVPICALSVSNPG